MRKIIRKRHKKSPFLYYFAVIFLIIAIILVICDTRVRPVIKRKVRDCARTDSVLILNRILLEQIDELKINYSDIAHIGYGTDGSITSIEIDTAAVNTFKAAFALSASRALREIDEFEFSLRLGTLLGPEFLTERGPKIPFKVASSEYVQTEILSKFLEAGINQTVHRILLEVTVNICCYFPGYSTSVTVNSELTLAETVIIGDVPQFYSGGK